jgi:hypothetical protein
LTEAHREKLVRKYAIDVNDPRVAELIKQEQLRSISVTEAIQLLGWNGLESGGILLAYPIGDAFTIRLDVPLRGKDGKERKYLRPSGQGNRLFIPPWANLAAEIWLTEGEFKALACALRGLPCVAVAGVWNWRRDVSEIDPAAAAAKLAGEKIPDSVALLPELARDWSGVRFILVYDSDITQEHPAWPAFGRLAEQLYARGAASVKIITLPALPELEKTGLDDYIRVREEQCADPVAELQALAKATPEWIPSGDGAERYAEARLASSDPAEQVRGAAALLAAGGETALQAALRRHRIRGEVARAIRRDAQRLLQEIREKQEPRQRPREIEGRDMTACFPPLREVFPAGLPFPEPPRENTSWDIRDGRVVLVGHRQFGDEVVEVVTPVLDTVAVLTRRLAPLEAGTDAEKWEVAWFEPASGQWRRAHVPASWLFDAAQRRWLIEAGVPVNSENASHAVLWFHALRMAVLRGQVPVPVTATVNRCGWFQHDGKLLFVLGPEVIEARDARGAAAGDREEYEPDSPDADAEVGWALDISANEQQILSGFRVKGGPAQQREFLLETAVKYPQVAFGLGCAAGAPLVRFAQAAGLSEVAGFTVLMHSGNAGRKGRQGKTAWSQVVASFWGCPEVGERLRYADRTRVHMGVLLSTCCDLTVHLEDLQKIAHEAKKAVVEEIDYLLHLVAAGMDRERGARAGGGRRTRLFKSVVFATAEYDVTASIPAGSGAHDRVLKLPALLPEDCDANKVEADRISKMACTHYGHAGREYLQWLINHVNEHGTDEVVRSIEAAIRVLTDRLPSDERRGSAGRLAKRAGIGLAGLLLWLESAGADDQIIRQAVDSFLAGWAMVCSEIPVEDLAERAVEVIQAYVSENREQFHGFRAPGERPPARWLGALAKVAGRECIVLFENALAEVLERRGLDINQVKKALRAAGKIMTVTEDGKERMTVGVCKADLRGRGIAIPLAVLELEEEEVGDE